MTGTFTRAIGVALTGLLLAACGQETGPWLAFDGGGFVVNYSGGFAAAYYGFNVKPQRRIPAGTILEAVFEAPAGAPPFIDRQEVKAPALRYSFRTPYIDGLEANHPYKAEIRVLESGTRKLLASYTTTFTSKYDDAWLKK